MFNIEFLAKLLFVHFFVINLFDLDIVSWSLNLSDISLNDSVDMIMIFQTQIYYWSLQTDPSDAGLNRLVGKS